MNRSAIMVSVLLVQSLCALFFVSDILSAFFGITAEPLPWQWREVLEILAAIGLVLGVALGAVLLRHTMRARSKAERSLARASSEFMLALAARFEEWGLTPAEKDVALFAIKGLSTAEIAALRATSDGTIKAQTNAIYRKAGVSGRAQLISLFIEDLIETGPFAQPSVPVPAPTPAPTPARKVAG